jgi:hypothetical protein
MHKEKLSDCSLCLSFPCVFVRPLFNCATFYEFPMYVGKTSPGITSTRPRLNNMLKPHFDKNVVSPKIRWYVVSTRYAQTT